MGEWRSIEKKRLLDFTEDESNVSKILKLSFDNLPSPLLKKCFAYCSIMPKGKSMEKDEMIHLWMAEGLVQTDEEKDMEIMGETVFNILLRSSLLQVQKRYYWYEIEECFGMHDLVHDLASYILNSRFHEGAHQIRYMSRSLTEESSPISKEQAKCLRALFFGGKISNSMLSNLTRLHVLILNDGEMRDLPTEIGKLICLRLLDISNTGIESLPDSISDLYHLQTLRTEEYGVSSCLRKLPHTFKFLSSLRHVYIPNISLPPEIGKLIFLQTLPFFQVSNELGCGIKELGSLKNLRGKIEICNLEKVRDEEEAKKAGLSHKHAIQKLELVWSYRRKDDHDNDENVLEGLQPHWNLESLQIYGFKGKSFPSWTLRMEVREDEWIPLDNLLEIKLLNCSACEEIPMMGHLPHLKSLYIEGLSKVKSIGSSFYGIKPNEVNKDSSTIIFPALEKLVLRNMKILTSWTEVELPISCGTQVRELSVFPHLEYLRIVDCRELKSAPSHFPCLKELEIDSMKSGSPFASICGSKLITLTKLDLRRVDGLVCLPDELLNNNRHLQELEIDSCDNLMHLVPCLGGGGASLMKLLICNCLNFAKFPEDLHKLNAMEELEIYDCGNLKSIAYRQSSSQGLTSLRHLKFLSCSGLSNLPCEMVESCAPSLEMLYLIGLESLTNLQQVMSILPRMSRLKELRIIDVPKLGDVVVDNGCFSRIAKLVIGGGGDYGSFKSIVDRIFSVLPCLIELELQGKEEWDCDIPDHQIKHLSTLHTLCLHEFGIQVLPQWLERLPSLRHLKLRDCKELRHVGSKKSMQGLTKLDISNCHLLTQNLKEGSDDSKWSKVSHIPKILVDRLPFPRP